MNEFSAVASDEAVAIARILANDHVADIVEALTGSHGKPRRNCFVK